MGTLTDKEVSGIINNLQSLTSSQSCRTGLPSKDFMLDFVDIDRFIEVLYSMLQSGGYLCSHGDCDDHGQFIFTQEYPDTLIDSNRIVSASISKRSPANLSANADPFRGTTHYRPIYMGSTENSLEGGLDINLQNSYDNSLVLTCWATKLVTASKLALLIESIMQKYYYILRKYVPVFVYRERGDTVLSDENGPMRYFGIPLEFFVRTNERFILKECELRNINIEYSIG